jgi:serine/threonine protein kinase
MALTAGMKLGPYEILAPLGAGGMGEVYRARDTRLERDVAVKVLPSDLSSDSNLRQRLEREAKAVSKLSHPHICTLHDIGHQDGIDFLVMELVEGETLEQRLLKGSLPPAQTIHIAAQVADALGKAHKLGFVHRDLKPANVMLTKGGAKLMDFGLAKQSGPAPLATALTEMTMEQAKLTSEGMLVGTFQYMAPEQLEGKEADARADIFALGELIYEMATGKPAFSGRSRASLIAAILTAEPPPMETLQPMTPVWLGRVVKKCLAKDPDERWQSASDLAAELKWIAEAGSQSDRSMPQPAQRTKRERWIWSAAVAVLLAALAGLYFRASPQPTQPTWSHILAPENTTLAYFAGPVTVSHNGRSLAFVATSSGGQDMVWVRPLAGLKAQELAGTEGGSNPFWSPDDRFIGFFSRGKLKTVDAAGGPVLTVCDVAGSRGGTWSQNGTILFSATWGVVQRVPSSGGTPVPITKLDQSLGELSHRWPYFLPDGRHYFFSAANFSGGTAEVASIYLGDLDSSQSKLLFHARSNAVYAPGHILFVRDRMLMAQPFDEKRLEIQGQPFPIAEQIQYDELPWRGVFSSSFNGVIAYQGGNTGANSRLIMLDRTGKELRGIGMALRIEGDELTLVLDVHVDVSVPIGLRKLRLAAQWDAAHNSASAGVDGAGVFSAATVECEDSFAGGIVEDGVRVFAGQVDPLYDLHLLQVEHIDRVLCAEICGLEFGSKRDGVGVMRFADVGKLLSAGVHHENMISAWDEDVAGGWIDAKIIPAALSAESDLCHQLVVGGVGGGFR